MFYTYISQSEKSGRYHIGHTENVEARLRHHNSGMVKATKGKGLWVLKYFETYDTRAEADKRELYKINEKPCNDRKTDKWHW